MTPTPGVCPHCGANVVRTRSALTGRAVTLSTHPLDRRPNTVDWELDQAGYAYPTRKPNGRDNHHCQEANS